MVRGVAVRARLAALLAMAIVAAAACSPGRANPNDADARATAAKHATKQLEEAGKQDLGCKNIVTSREKRETTPPDQMVLLTDASVAPEACWDRVTFTFVPTGANLPPGYTIEYRDPPFTEGDEGQFPVETLGDAFLYLTFAPASQTDLSSGREVQTYKGPIRLLFHDTSHIVLVRKLKDFSNGTQSWIIGLDEKRPFTVDAVADSAKHESRVSVYILK
jgi:hypothetical protein